MDERMPDRMCSHGAKKSSWRQQLGQAGEETAAAFLTANGLQIFCRNYRCPKGEIDIIAMDGTELVFVEVRTRSSSNKGWGEESITLGKKSRIQTVATYYLLERQYSDWPPMRFDVLALRWTESAPEINWLKGM